MPSGRTHTLASLAAAALLAPSGIPAAIGCAVGVVLTPDLDLPRGPRLWRLYWTPYERVMGHRSRLSHFPILGTALRIVYALPLLLPWLVLFGYSDAWLPDVGAGCMGLILSDVLHCVMDVI